MVMSIALSTFLVLNFRLFILLSLLCLLFTLYYYFKLNLSPTFTFMLLKLKTAFIYLNLYLVFLPILYLSCLLHAVAPGRSLYQDHTLSSADAANESEEDENWQEKEASRTHSVKFNTAETESDPNKEVC